MKNELQLTMRWEFYLIFFWKNWKAFHLSCSFYFKIFRLRKVNIFLKTFQKVSRESRFWGEIIFFGLVYSQVEVILVVLKINKDDFQSFLPHFCHIFRWKIFPFKFSKLKIYISLLVISSTLAGSPVFTPDSEETTVSLHGDPWWIFTQTPEYSSEEEVTPSWWLILSRFLATT